MTPVISDPTPGLAEFLERSSRAPDAAVLDALRTPIAESQALALGDIDRLRDPAPLPAENGWCWSAEQVAYVAVRTEMAGTTGEMWDWWFDWHARDELRYRVWHPQAHYGVSFTPPSVEGAKPFWGAVHIPDEDVGVGRTRIRIEFTPPSQVGFADDALEDERVATIVCGYTGEVARRVRVGRLAHVFLRTEDGVALRSRFWVGSDLRPQIPGAAGDALGALINRRFVRRRAIPQALPRALAEHCATEYARLAALLPELHARYGGASSTSSATRAIESTVE